MRATAKDLRFHSKELLDTVSRGEEVIITYRGKPRAKLVQIKKEVKKRHTDNELFGIWKNNNYVKNVDKYVRDLRKGRTE